MNNEPTKMVSCRLPLKLIERIQTESELSGRRIGHIISHAIDDGLPRREPSDPPTASPQRRAKAGV